MREIKKKKRNGINKKKSLLKKKEAKKSKKCVVFIYIPPAIMELDNVLVSQYLKHLNKVNK